MKSLVTDSLFANSQIAIDKIILRQPEKRAEKEHFPFGDQNVILNRAEIYNKNGKVKFSCANCGSRDKKRICWKRKCRQKQRESVRFVVIDR